MPRRGFRPSQDTSLSIPRIIDILQHRSLYDIGYETAAEYLQQLREAIGDTLDSALKTAECELRSQRGKEEESIQRVRGVLERFGASTADCVLVMGEKYDKGDHRQRVQALVMYHIAHQMHLEHQLDHDPDNVARWINRLVYDVRLAAYNLADEKGESSKVIAVMYGAKLAEKLLNYMRMIDIPDQLQIHARAVCTYHIADIYFRAKNYETSLPLLEEATNIFKGLTCENEYDHEQYCRALWTLGNCYYRLNDFAKAEKQYITTIAEVKRLPATAAKWLKIANADMIKTFFFLGKEPPNLEALSYVVNTSDEDLIKRVIECEDLDSLESLLEIAGCELRLRRGREEISIRRVKRKIFADGIHTAESILKKSAHCGVGLIEQKVKALILYRMSHKLFRQERHSVDETVESIQNLVQDIQLTAYDLAAQKGVPRTIAVNYGAKYAEYLLRFLLGIENATPSLLYLAVARCFYHIANIYFRAEDYDRSLFFFRRAKLFFTGVFPLTAHKFERYCLALWNIGNCYFRMRKFDDAVRSYRDAFSGVARSSPSIEQRWLKIVKRDHTKAVARSQRLICPDDGRFGSAGAVTKIE